MKNVFLCFTPYHIKVANKITSKVDGNNSLCIFQNVRLNDFVEKSSYTDIQMFFEGAKDELKLSEYIKKPSLIKKVREEKQRIVESYKNFDRIFIFSDDHIYLQSLLLEVRGKKKIILIEEGTAMYLANKKFSIKDKLRFNLKSKLIFGEKRAKLFTHAKGGFENFIVAREPDLLEQNSEKIQITREFLKEVFVSDKIVNIDRDAYLYAPSLTTYNKEIMLETLKIVIHKIVSKNENLIIRVHPREKYTIEIKELIKEYENNVVFYEESGFTSEDLLLNKNIKGVISDYSSILINTYYLREELPIYSVWEILNKEHNVDFGWEISIFNYLYEKNIIQNFNEF